MRKLSTIAAALSAAFCVGAANASFITLDDFSIPATAQELSDLAGGGATVGAAIVASPSGASRVASHEMLAGPGGSGNFVKVGNTTFPAGMLEVANTSGQNAEVKINWTISAGLLGSGTVAAFGLWLHETDGNPTTVKLSMGATDLGTINLPINGGPNQLQLFPTFSAAQVAAVNAGGLLTMTLTGADGWDLAVDAVGFQIPEPTSLALVGLALIGAGAASRRRAA